MMRLNQKIKKSLRMDSNRKTQQMMVKSRRNKFREITIKLHQTKANLKKTKQFYRQNLIQKQMMK